MSRNEALFRRYEKLTREAKKAGRKSKERPVSCPLFHSDKGFQYTGKPFCTRLKKHHMKQSMSRVAHCTDNGPMEGFWGILKREMYYGKKFTSKGDLITAVESYIRYYNTERIQRKMHLMTPAEFHDHFDAAA